MIASDGTYLPLDPYSALLPSRTLSCGIEAATSLCSCRRNLFHTHEVFYAVDTGFAYIIQFNITILDNLPAVNVYVLISEVNVQLPGHD